MPLSNSNLISKELGTRHRAAVGISERSDAIVIVVSEETGNISIVESGRIDRYFDEDSFKQRLKKDLVFVREETVDDEKKEDDDE